MGAALAAARIGDPIEHTSALMGFLIGAVVGLAIGVALVAATVATGGLALVAAVGAGMAATGGMALLGEKIGQTFTSTCGMIVAPCSLNVRYNSRNAARAVVDMGACSKDGPPPVPIAQGSKRVSVNKYPAARKDDKMVCGGKIADGSPNVRIGTDPGTFLEIQSEVPDWMNNLAEGLVLVGSAIALVAGAAAAIVAGGVCGLIAFGGEVVGGIIGGVVGADVGGRIGKAIGGERGEIIGEAVGGFIGGFFGAKVGGRAVAGHPVDVATGELLTENTDFQVNGPLPLAWSRLWISSSTVNGALGHGWHHSYDMALSRWTETGYYVARLVDGRLAFFTPPEPGKPAINTVEQMVLETDGRSFRLVDYSGIAYEFGPVAPDRLRHLSRVADANGNAIALERDAAGRLFSIVDSGGRRFVVTNDAAGRILAIDGPGKLRLASYSYDAAGDMVESRDARGSALRYSYSNHLLIEEQRRGGLVFHFVWDDVGLGRKARCIDTWGDRADGELYRATLDYDVETHTTVVTTGRGAITHYRWNAIGRVEEEAGPLGPLSAVTHQQYDEGGRVVRITGPSGEITANSYDALGRLVARTDAAGGSTTLEYAPQGPTGIGLYNPARITLPGGGVHTLTHDARGNLATHVDPTGLERRFERNARGLPLTVIDAEGTWRRFEWSAAGDLMAEGTERGIRTRYTRDGLGRVLTVARGEDRPTRFVRDPNGNLTEVQRPDGGTVTLDYDAEDRVMRHRDPIGRETRWRYDGLPFPLERINPDGSRFGYSYDSELNLTGLENPKGERYVIEYDLAARMTREVGFDGRVLEYKLDPSGRLLEQLDAGRPTKFVRDPLGRLLEKNFADGTAQCFDWDALGNLTAAESAERRVEFGYDKAGRLVAEDQGGQTLMHRYDARGRRVETTLPDGRKIQVGYGRDDLFSSVAFDGAMVADLVRDASGREVERDSGGVRQEQSYDPQGRLVRQQGLRKSGGIEAVFVRRYGYDQSDALTSINDTRRGLKRYQYDACDRLIGVNGTDPESFVFDPAGNILASGPNAGRSTGEAKGDRLVTHNDRKFFYDEHGNRVHEYRAADGVEVDYRYGPDNQLVEVETTSGKEHRITRFGYDALGRRAWKESAGKRTEFLWNGNVLVAESDSKTDPLATVYMFEPGSFRPLAQARRTEQAAQASIYHYHLDHLGTPQELTTGEGEVVWAADLKAWGAVRVRYAAKIENPLRFQGQYHDDETGLHYNYKRYYDPNVGGYLTPDPIGLFGGTQSYAYAPNPIRWVDPLGLSVDYYPLDSLGRPTGALIDVTAADLRPTGTSPPTLDPPGWVGGQHPYHQQRSHLAADTLGGSGSDERNLVTLTDGTNHPGMSQAEGVVRSQARSGNRVLMEVTPEYEGTSLTPKSVKMYAIDQNGKVVVDRNVENGLRQQTTCCI